MHVCMCACVSIGFREIGTRGTTCYDKTDERSVKSRVFRIAPEQRDMHTSSVGGRGGNMNVKSTEITCSLTDRQKN